jgi:hypothetical protein
MAEPRNTGGLIGFDETATGGNTNSGTGNSNPTPPESAVPPFPPPPPPPPNPPNKTPKKVDDDNIEASTVPLLQEDEVVTKPSSKNLREILDEDTEEIVKEAVGNFVENGTINIAGEYPQNFVSVPTYDLTKINVVGDDEVDFDFVLCLKDGEGSIPDLYATRVFYDLLINEYNEGRPFGVNDIIEEKNIVVIDIGPLKEKVEFLRKQELSINLNRNEIAGQVEVRKNLFVNSNYEVGQDKVLIANPSYDIIELLRYITWVVTKPAQKYDDRLIPASDLGDYDGYEKEKADEETPSDKVDDKDDNSGGASGGKGDGNYKEDPDSPPDPAAGSFPPIGRRGLEPGETVLYNGKYYEWDAINRVWIIDTTNNGENPEDEGYPNENNPPTDNDGSDGGTGGTGNTGGPGNPGTGGPAIRD